MEHIFPEIRPVNDQAKVVWLYGLSGSGKSTLAKRMQSYLLQKGKTVFILDGDNLRYGLNSDLGFSKSDRQENIRRAIEVTKILCTIVDVVICTFITPFESLRLTIQKELSDYDLHLVYVDTPLDLCRERDTKGLYAKASAGDIKNFTGIGSDFESPVSSQYARVDCANKAESESLLDIVEICRFL